MSFREADERYAELKRHHEAGDISDEDFDARLKQLMVRDSEGRVWAKGRTAGVWHYRDGSRWVAGTPYGDNSFGGPAPRQGATLRGLRKTVAIVVIIVIVGLFILLTLLSYLLGF